MKNTNQYSKYATRQFPEDNKHLPTNIITTQKNSQNIKQCPKYIKVKLEKN